VRRTAPVPGAPAVPGAAPVAGITLNVNAPQPVTPTTIIAKTG